MKRESGWWGVVLSLAPVIEFQEVPLPRNNFLALAADEQLVRVPVARLERKFWPIGGRGPNCVQPPAPWVSRAEHAVAPGRRS